MRKETAVGLAALIVVAALIYATLASRDSIEEFRSGRRAGEIITLKRRAPPGPGLLSVASPIPSPRPSAAAAAVATNSLSFPEPLFGGDRPPEYPADSLCGFLGSFWKGSQKDFDRRMGEYLEDVWPRDGSLELFLAVQRGDWREVGELGRTSRTNTARELGLLSRVNLFSQETGRDSGESPVGSLDPRDLAEVEEMRFRDPGNSFWPLAEAYLKEREKMPVDRALLLAEAASLPTYRNPIMSFYGEVKRTALETGDDRAFLATENLMTRVPMLSEGFHRSLRDEVGKSADGDEMLKWIGKTMESAQFRDVDGADDGTRIDAIQGSFMDARMGQVLGRMAEGKPKGEPGEARAMMNRFSVTGETNALVSTLEKGCDDDRLHGYFERLRARVRTLR